MVNPQLANFKTIGDNVIIVALKKECITMKMKPVTYPGVKPNRYFITDTGELYRKECGKLTRLNGCNPKNEKGYIRSTLATDIGGVKKFSVHRLVMNEFVGPSELEVNHKDGNKTNNSLTNLEYVTGDENKHHAAITGLYLSCEDAPNAVLTNKQVHEICRLFEQGHNIRKIIKILNLPKKKSIETRLWNILQRNTWTHISDSYKWDYDDVRLKVYRHKDLVAIAYLIQTNAYLFREIAEKFPKYNKKKLTNVIKKMHQGKLYKSIMDEVRCSTTINASDLRNADGFRLLVRKRKL